MGFWGSNTTILMEVGPKTLLFGSLHPYGSTGFMFPEIKGPLLGSP